MKSFISILLLSSLLLCSCAGGKKTDSDGSSDTVEKNSESSQKPADTVKEEEMGKSGLKKNAVVVFTGDSITDGYRKDRTDPNDLGQNNYVTMFNDYIQKNFPEDNIKVYNTGYSGYWIQHLHNDLKPFVLDLDPDYLIVNIGTNNCWFDKGSIENVEKEYRSLIDDIQAKTKAKLIIVQPYLYECDFVLDGVPLNDWIPRMSQISDIVCRVGAEKNIPVIYYSDIFRQAMIQYDYPYKPILSVDGIHPNTIGYKMFYNVLCQELGIKGFKSKYSFDFSEIKAKYGVK